ncbi:uncharacterized protein FIBRA_05739 [Fibroporia radiculosa]|uniref:C2H2-type domain-containing protein n=1 Tax=Fibroporia radiculosa TaxID=599839 RepID=J4IAW1_9APHY|nr:uncharacterized protein FIBRA_05739 [Fibroporia radiculosa]CCM03601.1 predicted protein [Fibroporia radiculosa]
MNWDDIFCTAESRSRSHSPPPFSQIECEFCSDFSCCGVVIADLHELLSHFEEYHVVALDQDDPLDPSQDSDAAAHGCTGIVPSYPQPNLPPPPTAVLGVLDSDASTAGLVSSGSSESHSEPSSPPREDPEWIPTRALPSLPSIQSTTVKPEGARVLITHNARNRVPKHPPAPKAQVLGTTHAHAPRLKKRAREKTYNCPRPGCSKSYRNPNGLDYHLAKGTCIIEPVPPPES